MLQTHNNMKQYNRIMPGAGAKYIDECLKGGFIGVDFIKEINLVDMTDKTNETEWRQKAIKIYLEQSPEKSKGTARISVGYLWTVCFGLNVGDVILAPDGQGNYRVGEITGEYQFYGGTNLPHRRPVAWSDKVIQRSAISQKLRNSMGSIGTCCNITKYAEEIEQLINCATGSAIAQIESQPTKYKERSLHPLLTNYLFTEDIYAKTIFHETSKGADNKKWVHPDMVGVRFNDFQNNATSDLIKAADAKSYIELYSYELKRSIDNDHNLKEYFFQALSNSSWANYGYLVAFDISDSVLEEMERLNRAFGIGLIHLSPYPDDTKILFQARKNALDYYTIDKLCKLNNEFEEFIERTTKVLNAGARMLDDVREGLKNFCDKIFNSDDEITLYCAKENIPL